MKHISKTVWVLSFVSLFTDMASELLYPIMPVYLESIGFSVLIIGVLEGVAEATAGLSKGFFGQLSDHSGKRVPFVRIGYFLSAVSKPLMGVFITPIGIFFARTLDRFGKGVRTGARDAILSDETVPETKGRVFGLHRSMDTLGAVLGPAMALLYLYFFPEDYKTLFFLAIIPGVLAVIATYLLKEKKTRVVKNVKEVRFFSFINYWKQSSAEYRKLLIGLLLFALINSSDFFLLLKMKESGLGAKEVISVYIFYNLVYAFFSYPLGKLGDRIGLKIMYALGILCFTLVYFGMAIFRSVELYLFFFFLYGIYAAATEGIAKAWISNISSKETTATAIGTYSAFQSIAAMIASSVAGLIWYNYSSNALFLITGIGAFFITLYVFSLKSGVALNKKAD